MNIHPREIILVGGKTGLGKSYLVKNNLLKDYNRVIIADLMDEYPGIEFDNIENLAEYAQRHKVFRVKSSNYSDFNDLCYITQQIKNTCLIVEESQRYIPARGITPPEFDELVFRGRHYGSSLILICQRFSTVNINVRSQWHKIISFRQTEKIDCEWLRQTSGFDLDELEKLPPGKYYEITPKQAIIYGNIFS